LSRVQTWLSFRSHVRGASLERFDAGDSPCAAFEAGLVATRSSPAPASLADGREPVGTGGRRLACASALGADQASAATDLLSSTHRQIARKEAVLRIATAFPMILPQLDRAIASVHAEGGASKTIDTVKHALAAEKAAEDTV
jgi:hypothetical protein